MLEVLGKSTSGSKYGEIPDLEFNGKAVYHSFGILTEFGSKLQLVDSLLRSANKLRRRSDLEWVSRLVRGLYHPRQEKNQLINRLGQDLAWELSREDVWGDSLRPGFMAEVVDQARSFHQHRDRYVFPKRRSTNTKSPNKASTSNGKFRIIRAYQENGALKSYNIRS